MNADRILLIRPKGAYARPSLEGSVVDTRRGLNKAYYSRFRSSHCGSLIEMSQYLVNLKRRLQEEALRKPPADSTYKRSL